METILNYLENMFANLPHTPEVMRAKEDLAAMMEDKYNELIAEGKKENEAVGIVISEFGNISEIASELGIDDVVNGRNDYNKGETIRTVSMYEGKEYLAQVKESAKWIGIGVMLCIISPVMLLILGGLQEYVTEISDVVVVMGGLVVLLVLVAIAVGLFIYHGTQFSHYEWLQKEDFILDLDLERHVKFLKESREGEFITKIIIGVGLCIVAVIPLIVAGVVFDGTKFEFLCVLAVALLLMIVSIAVYLFITAGNEKQSYSILLQENDYTRQKKYIQRKEDSIGGIYWSLVTAIYLLWSFISFSWAVSWIIWPIAGVLYGAVVSILKAVHHE